MIEIRQLKYFVCVAELEHFGKAAEYLHIVQPALSRQIKQLEDELEVELFERLPRGVRLTVPGRIFLERAKVLLDDLERMVSVTRLAGAGKTGFLRIGFADGATYSGHVPSILGAFRKLYPRVELDLLPAGSVAQGELLQQERIDVGFVYWLPADTNGIEHVELNKESVVLAAAKSNKAILGKRKVKLEDLRNLPFVWIKRADSPMFYDLILSRCNRRGLTLNVVQEAFTESTMLSLVAADIGVTFITESARRRKPDNVELLTVEDLDATITLKAMWRKSNRNPALSSFIANLS